MLRCLFEVEVVLARAKKEIGQLLVGRAADIAAAEAAITAYAKQTKNEIGHDTMVMVPAMAEVYFAQVSGFIEA